MVAIKNFGLMMFALIVIVLAAPIALAVQIIRMVVMRESLAKLFFAVAIGLDQLGGSIIYLEPDWTVSSRTYFLRVSGNKYAAVFENVINNIFGDKHCENSFNKEFVEMKGAVE